MCAKCQLQKIHPQKDTLDPPTCIVARENFTIANFTIANFLRIELFFFCHKFFLQNQPYVNKMCAKFQVQKIHLQKNVQNLPLCSCKGQLPTSVYKLIDLKYLFVGESFEVGIWHTCYMLST